MSQDANFPPPRIGERRSYKAWLYLSAKTWQEGNILITSRSAEARRRIEPLVINRSDLHLFPSYRFPKRCGLKNGQVVTVTIERLQYSGARGRYGGGMVAWITGWSCQKYLSLRRVNESHVCGAFAVFCRDWFGRHFGRRDWEGTYVRLWVK